MKQLFTLLLALAACAFVEAQTPNVAKISRQNQTTEEPVISISNLERIQFMLNDNNQVKSVFVFDDQTQMTFEDVSVIEFLDGGVVVDSGDAQSISTAGDLKISVYPNPVTETLHISGMKAESKGAVINISGQYICEINGKTADLNVSGWAEGTYLLRIDNQIFKLIKQ